MTIKQTMNEIVEGATRLAKLANMTNAEFSAYLRNEHEEKLLRERDLSEVVGFPIHLK